MARHIYAVVVDVPERNERVAAELARVASQLMIDIVGPHEVQSTVMVPGDKAATMRPRLRLVEEGLRA